MEELRNELREIVNKPATKLTNSDKSFLSDAAERAGVDDTVTNTRCGTCWHELAMKIYDAIAETDEQSGEQPQHEETQNAEQRRYVLKKGVDVIFGKIGRVGVRVNALTLTDELGDKLIEAGFPKKYFEKCE